MNFTDYHSTNKNEIATIPYIAHEIIVTKHRRREIILAIALTLSVIIGIANHLL